MRFRLRRATVAGLAIGLLGAAPTSVAGAGQEPAGGGQAAAAAPARDDGRRTMSGFAANLLRGAVGVFSTDSIRPLVIGGAATGIGAIFDDEVADRVADPGRGFGRSFEDGASPAMAGAVVAVLFATGRAADGPRYRAMTYDWAQAFLINAGYTALIKEAVGRERPDGENDRSFPSGHASNAFALAAVTERHYGWKAGLPAYTLAGAVAASRLQRNKHYLSDVIAGATLGYIVGRTVVRVNNQPTGAARGVRLGVSPVISKRSRALVASITF